MKQTKKKSYEHLIKKLHKLWDDAQRECANKKHFDAKSIVLNYGHVQLVTICKSCFEKTREKHNQIVKEMGFRLPTAIRAKKLER